MRLFCTVLHICGILPFPFLFLLRSLKSHHSARLFSFFFFFSLFSRSWHFLAVIFLSHGGIEDCIGGVSFTTILLTYWLTCTYAHHTWTFIHGHGNGRSGSFILFLSFFFAFFFSGGIFFLLVWGFPFSFFRVGGFGGWALWGQWAGLGCRGTGGGDGAWKPGSLEAR